MLPDALDVAVVDGMLDGVLALADRHGVAVIGGNISRSPGPLVVDVTAVGSVRPRRLLRRGGARPGDGVYVTGTIGDALVGLEWLRASCGEDRTACAFPAQIERYLRPEPRVRTGMLLGRNRAASACMDLSDGLADALRQVAAASQVGMAIDGGALPITGEVRRWHETRGTDPVAAALQGGDDYELLFTARKSHRGRLRSVMTQSGSVSVTRIGEVTRDRQMVLRTAIGERPLPEGFEHFR
jgi:thiamine-monophosphate kinase